MKQQSTLLRAFTGGFLGNSKPRFKIFIVACLLINPILFFANPYLAGWALLIEFIVTLIAANKCYPLQSGGILALEAVLLGMTDVHTWWHEITENAEVMYLLFFMVAAIYFLKSFLTQIFIQLFLKVKRKWLLSLIFCLSAAILSAFLDALTVTAVIIGISVAFYDIFHKFSSGVSYELSDSETKSAFPAYARGNDDVVRSEYQSDLGDFRSFLRSLLMHAAVGTALGGVCTLVGEPQNLAIAAMFGLEFIEFLVKMAPVTIPVLIFGLLTCVTLEFAKFPGYGTPMPDSAREILTEYAEKESIKRTVHDRKKFIVQLVVALLLVAALATHWAEVGLIGLAVIILVSAFNGITDEHSMGPAFHEGAPFAMLLGVFFVVVSVIHDQHLFQPIMAWVFSLDTSLQPVALYCEAGGLSMISDNVFVALVNMGQILDEFGIPDGMTVRDALAQGVITQADHDQLLRLTIAVNTGTNIPSVATPNGQAAFLFLLTSAIAPLVGLDWMKMFKMALPYTIIMTAVGAFCVYNYI
jgi:NhaB family Na+:H+ antiporter